jgi:hypothetical protein
MVAPLQPSSFYLMYSDGRRSYMKLEKQISIRVKPADWEKIKRRAQRENRTPSAWLRHLAMRALGAREVIELTDDKRIDLP